MTSWLDELNTAQREAVTAGGGPLLIVAGAGTGKTRTLACRVAYLIEQGIAPERILLLTFTRRAAAEMLRRAGGLIGSSDDGLAGRVWGGTFHAVANRLLRIYGRALDLPEDFTILDESDAADLMNLIRSETGVAKQERRFPRKHTLASIYSRMVNAQESLEGTLAVHFPWCREDEQDIKTIFERYVQRKKEQHLLDYDDLLLFWSALCVTPGMGDTVANRFDHILVDEYQDTNPVQAEVLRGMRASSDNICVVGDDAQSIYGFRAATVRNILDFPQQFPGARIVTLEQNYRSIQPILTAANAVMAQAGERYTKDLWSQRDSEQKPVLITCRDEEQQSDVVCRNILDHLEQGVALMNQGVLFRASNHSAHLEIELARRNIPFRKYGGLKFVEAAHIKDVLALLRILENPYDEISWFRVLQLMEGIGPRTARRVMDHLGVRRAPELPGDRERTGEIASPLSILRAEPPTVPPASRESFAQLRSVLMQCSGVEDPSTREDDEQSGEKTDRAGPAKRPDAAGRKQTPLPAQMELVRQFYELVFERAYDNAPIRLRDVERLAQIAAGYRSRSRFLADLTLDPPRAASDLADTPFLEEDYLILSTIHSAKGCEWRVVHVIHAADGMIPSDMAVTDEAGVDEERRLFYVALTRAKDMLYVYFPYRYYHRRFRRGDAHTYAQLTRFLPANVCTLFDQQTADANGDLDISDQEAVISDPYRRVRRLWGE